MGFDEFRNASGVTPPRDVSACVMDRVSKDLRVSPWNALTKLCLVHFLTALGTLSVCPQFGFGFGEGHGLMHWFMMFGPIGCAIACGSLFVGMSLAVAGFVLRPEEVRALRKHRWAEITTLAMLSLGFFLMLDTDIALGFAAAWALGSVAGGALALEGAWRLRLARAV